MAIVEVKGVKIGQGLPKICVPLVGKIDRELIEQAINASQSDCDMVEVRIDYYYDVLDTKKVVELLHKIRESIVCPVLFTFRTLEEGGNQAIPKEAYKKLYEDVIGTETVDLVDLELNLGEDFLRPLINKAKKEGVKVVLSNHDFKKTPSTKEMTARLVRMQELGADIPKIAVMPETKRDVLRLMETILYMQENYSQTPVIGISMGAKGMPSRVLGGWLGSAITFGVVEQSSAPGQLSVHHLSQLLQLLENK